MRRARRDARAAHNYFIEILENALNLGTKTSCGLYRPPWALTTEYKLNWLGIATDWLSYCGNLRRARRDARAAHSILQPRLGNFWENLDIIYHLWLKVTLSWVKIGFKCPRLPIFLILGYLYALIFSTCPPKMYDFGRFSVPFQP